MVDPEISSKLKGTTIEWQKKVYCFILGASQRSLYEREMGRRQELNAEHGGE